jgi:hypothetical protein
MPSNVKDPEGLGSELLRAIQSLPWFLHENDVYIVVVPVMATVSLDGDLNVLEWRGFFGSKGSGGGDGGVGRGGRGCFREGWRRLGSNRGKGE